VCFDHRHKKMRKVVHLAGVVFENGKVNGINTAPLIEEASAGHGRRKQAGRALGRPAAAK
jgi:hypothetical protein